MEAWTEEGVTLKTETLFVSKISSLLVRVFSWDLFAIRSLQNISAFVFQSWRAGKNLSCMCHHALMTMHVNVWDKK